MRRREFIAGLAGMVAWPLAAWAQQPAMPVIGFLSGSVSTSISPAVAAFRAGLNEMGFVEGRNVAIEFRWAEGDYQRLPTMAAELVARQVAVIVAGGTIASPNAAKAATTTIPIVFSSGADPVRSGLVPSLGRPGGNLTGAFILTTELETKRLDLLHEVVPAANVIAMLVNPAYPNVEELVSDVQAAVRSLSKQIVVLHASSEREIEAAFASLVQRRIGALLVASDPFLFGRREQIVALANYHKVPAIYQWREFAALGGLMAYGTTLTETYRTVGLYTGRILKGEKPSDLPVVQSTKVEFVINLKTAKALGLTIPLPLLGRADEVIE
jgi:putative ABC transport system substrate-binding protein